MALGLMQGQVAALTTRTEGWIAGLQMAAIIFGVSTLIFKLRGGLLVLAILIWIYALYSLLVFLRTGNIPHLIVCAYQALLGVMAYVLRFYLGSSRVETIEFLLAYLSGIIFFGALLIYFAATRKLKWRGREIFELAGESVEEIGNGYTSRPRPSWEGGIQFSTGKRFFTVCSPQPDCSAYFHSKNITFVPIKMGEEFGRVLGLSGDFRDATWVNFDIYGEVSVHIAQKDYLDYRVIVLIVR